MNELKLEQMMTTPEDFVKINSDKSSKMPTFEIYYKSVFDIPADAYVNTINCVGVPFLVILFIRI